MKIKTLVTLTLILLVLAGCSNSLWSSDKNNEVKTTSTTESPILQSAANEPGGFILRSRETLERAELTAMNVDEKILGNN